MRVFTTTTKRKAIGLIMALATIAALVAVIVFAFAGETHHAISTATIFINMNLFMFATADHMNRKDARAKAAERRARLYA